MYEFLYRTLTNTQSDIIAEVDCPYPSILRYEDFIPIPDVVAAVADKIPVDVIVTYNKQLMLRTHLNQLHGMFYKPRNHG